MAKNNEHSEEHVHMHVKCPKCNGQDFAILVYPEVVLIKCVKDGEQVEFDDELVAAFRSALFPEEKN